VSTDAPEEDAPRPTEGDDAEEPEASPEAASDDAAAEARPARRKRKKKRPAAASEAAADEAASDEAASDEAEADEAASDERSSRRADIPAFALGFPEDPALAALVAAFEQGDYARVRREAPALVQRTESVAVRKAARELLKRLEPDPIAVYLLAGAGLLLAFLALWYWAHPHVAP
jgi:hypothetical protein